MSFILADDQSFKDLLALSDNIVIHAYNKGIFEKGIGKDKNKYPVVKKMYDQKAFKIVEPGYLSTVLDMQMFIMKHYHEGNIMVLLNSKEMIDVYLSLEQLFKEAGRELLVVIETSHRYYKASDNTPINLSTLLLVTNHFNHVILEEPAPGEVLEEAMAIAVEDDEEEYAEAIAVEDDEEEIMVAEPIEEDEEVEPEPEPVKEEKPDLANAFVVNTKAVQEKEPEPEPEEISDAPIEEEIEVTPTREDNEEIPSVEDVEEAPVEEEIIEESPIKEEKVEEAPIEENIEETPIEEETQEEDSSIEENKDEFEEPAGEGPAEEEPEHKEEVDSFFKDFDF